jgi:uncharacterized protein DUF6677
MAQPSQTATASEPTSPLLACFAAWLVPGAGHFLAGQQRRAFIFFGVLNFMYIVGLAFGGRLFPIATAEPLVLLAGAAQWLNGLARLAGAMGGFGEGMVTAATYEYGNTFLIVSGLLNALVILDAYDVVTGRKPR